ncbi:RHS repeat protein [Streptomyces sp. NBC_00727]|uniref:RHS repeat domain-containing protein n=1 Tax=Streptomyces sp. NBC_00727 TaxID=2903675 RepID=UPI00386F507D
MDLFDRSEAQSPADVLRALAAGSLYRTRNGSVTDPAGNHWTYTYDQLGRKISTTDPDQGTTDTTYDDRSQMTFVKGSRTDAPGLAYLYDDLGRQTEVREKSPTGTLRTKQVYDTVRGAKGQLAASTRSDSADTG